MVVLGKSASVVGLLSFGTMTSLFSKIVYEISSEGSDGKEHFFRKPWFMTTLMFVGMSFCLPLAWLEEHAKTRAAANASNDGSEPLLGNGTNGHEAKPKRPEWRDAIMLSIPTFFDLIATVLMNIGLLTVTASVYQMMRGAEMIFAAIFAILFLGRKLNQLHYSGIFCCVIGISLVGMSSVLSGQGGTAVAVTKGQILLGMTLIVMSQAVQAAQITFEDYFMSEMQISPMKIVGYEGTIGALVMIVLVLPIVRILPGKPGDGIHEDSIDTLHMIRANGHLATIIFIQGFALLSYNYMGMHVTGHLGAVFRTVLETMRTLFVWLVGLFLFYVGTGLGEAWDKYSFVQALGFVVLVCGTVVYGRGDERAASQAVEQYIAQQQADEEAAAEQLPDPNAPPGAAQPAGVPHPRRSQAAGIVMPSPSLRGNASLAANSYQEAIAASLRSRGMSLD